jgi:hypothetical protein
MKIFGPNFQQFNKICQNIQGFSFSGQMLAKIYGESDTYELLQESCSLISLNISVKCRQVLKYFGTYLLIRNCLDYMFLYVSAVENNFGK